MFILVKSLLEQESVVSKYLPPMSCRWVSTLVANDGVFGRCSGSSMDLRKEDNNSQLKEFFYCKIIILNVESNSNGGMEKYNTYEE